MLAKADWERIAGTDETQSRGRLNLEDPERAHLRLAKMVHWVLRLLVTRFRGAVTILFIVDLLARYSLLAAMVLVLSFFSENFLQRVAGILPASLADAFLATPTAPAIVIAGLVLTHIVFATLESYRTRATLVEIDRSLRADIIRNRFLWLLRRPAFARKAGPTRDVMALAMTTYPVVRAARATIAMIPAVIFLVTSMGFLVAIAPSALLWLAAVAIPSLLLQRLISKTVFKLEETNIIRRRRFRPAFAELIGLYDDVPNDLKPRSEVLPEIAGATEITKRRDAIEAEAVELSTIAFSRIMVSRLAQVASFTLVVGISGLFLLGFVLSGADLGHSAIIEWLIILVLVARVIVTSIPSIARSGAMVARSGYHAFPCYRYYEGPPQKDNFHMPPMPLRFIGPVRPSRYGISYYVDGMYELCGADLRRMGELVFLPGEPPILRFTPPATKRGLSRRAAPPAMNAEIVTIDNHFRKNGLDLEPGNVVFLYTRIARISRKRSIDRVRLKRLFAWDAARARAAAQQGMPTAIIDEDDAENLTI